MSEEQMPKEEIIKDVPTSEEVVQEIIEEEKEKIPEMHPVHKTKMVLLIVVTIVLGLVSIISLLFVLRMKEGKDLFSKMYVKKEPVVEQKVEEKKEEVKEEKKIGEFDVVDIFKDLDNLRLEDIEKEYSDSGLN